MIESWFGFLVWIDKEGKKDGKCSTQEARRCVSAAAGVTRT